MLEKINAIICDMDGVLWRGHQPLPGLMQFFRCLRAHGIDFVLATNNSGNTPDDYARKLDGLGVSGIHQRHIITSGTATASCLQEEYPPGSRVYVIGGPGLKRVITEAGFTLTDDGAELVLCGIDREFSYDKARRATLLIRGGADFIGTNPDASFPAPDGLAPGAGSILAMLEAASGTAPRIIGKPERGMFEAALRQLNARPETTLMIGDRIGTDIQGAQALGIRTALVMTGVETETSLAASAVKPDWVFPGLPELTKALDKRD